MRFRYFGKTQLGKYSANFNWKVPLNGPYKVWLIPWQSNKEKAVAVIHEYNDNSMLQK